MFTVEWITGEGTDDERMYLVDYAYVDAGAGVDIEIERITVDTDGHVMELQQGMWRDCGLIEADIVEYIHNNPPGESGAHFSQ